MYRVTSFFWLIDGAVYPAAPALHDPATCAGGPQGLSVGDGHCVMRGGSYRIVASDGGGVSPTE